MEATMIHFECDYTEGAHPRILARLLETNEEQTSGYGEDAHCAAAVAFIRKRCADPDVDVHFISGGTQTNLTAIASILRPHQGVISSVVGHVEEHETGAIEATGHKVLTLPSDDGKISADQVDGLCESHFGRSGPEHMVQPGMVYISHPTENGTLYTKPELTALRQKCDKWRIPLYMDGARLGYGLAAARNEAQGLTLPDIAALCDLFYIGGTKVGAMFGEALVIVNEKYKKDFRYHIKQRGAMLAKGRMLGIQFETLFEDGLYDAISAHAVAMADLIREACADKGYTLLYDALANQVFPVFPVSVIQQLTQKYIFFTWAKAADKDGQPQAAVRLCTSWATKEEHARQLAEDIRKA